MPIGKASRSTANTTTPLHTSSTTFVATRQPATNEPLLVVPTCEDETLPTYTATDVPIDFEFPKTLQPPSSDHALEYFDAIANNKPCSIVLDTSMLTLHFYRTTQTQIAPIEERLALGSTLKRPFFALKASPSTMSVDEYNKLALVRRNVTTNNWQHVAISEVFPRLKLLSKGTMKVAKLSVGVMPEVVELFWDSERETYTVWRSQRPEIEIVCEGWYSLDDKPGIGAGCITVRSTSGDLPTGKNKIAVLDFAKASPQFMCIPLAGPRLDLIMVSLLTVATVHTRRPKLISQTLVGKGYQMQVASNTILVHTKQTANINVAV